MNLFVYADMETKIKRCQERSPEKEHLPDKEMRREIGKVDANRARRYELIALSKWGNRGNYQLSSTLQEYP